MNAKQIFKAILLFILFPILFLFSCGDNSQTQPSQPSASGNVAVLGVTFALPSSETEPHVIKKGETLQLSANINPYNATNKKVTYKLFTEVPGISVNPNTGIVSVSSSAADGAKAKIQVTTDEGNFTAIAFIQVFKELTGISIWPSNLTITKGETKKFKVNLTPADASYGLFKWQVEDTTLASIDGEFGMEKNLSAKSIGTTKLKVTSGNGLFTAEATVNIIFTDVTAVQIVPISSVATPVQIAKGNSRQLVADISPANASNKKVTWNLKSPVAGVSIDNATGKLTILDSAADNTAFEIEVTTEDQGKKATAYAIVKSAPSVTNMTTVTPEANIVLPIGGSTKTITHEFEISQTEMTYELWEEIYDWATTRVTDKYTFSKGWQGGIKEWGISVRAKTEGSKKQPVVQINWYDAVIFCNAYTEWYNEKNPSAPLTVVYKDSSNNILRNAFDTATLDALVMPANEKFVETGFRLPTSAEWEFAARFLGKDNGGRTDLVSTTVGTNTYYWMPDTSVSGAVITSGDNDQSRNFAWVEQNSCYADDALASSGKCKTDDQTSAKSTHPVSMRMPNHLGLYDMSGNVTEWCFDKHSTTTARSFRGGSWADDIRYFLKVNEKNFEVPSFTKETIGLRVVRTINP